MKELKEIFKLNITNYNNLDGDVNYSNIKYSLQDNNGKMYILKIFPDKDELRLAKEESIILNEIGKSLSFKVPQTLKTPDGNLFFSHQKGEAKLLDYIEGEFIASVPNTPELLFSLGEKIAELNLALQNIESPLLASRRLFWDLQYASLSYHKTSLIKEPDRRKLIKYYFDRFQQIVLPQQHQLRHSIIHGDLNDYNILIKDGKIEGFLDFGDSSYSPMVNDIAIAMTYMMLDKEKPFDEVLPLLKGYHSINPLTQNEVELLPELITTRLCISLCNSAEKKHLGVDNDYVLISEKPAWALLEKWITVNPIKIKDAFLRETGFAIQDRESKRNVIIQSRNRIAGKSLGLSYKTPIHMTSAAFQYMYDDTGNTYLDAYNNIPHIGHSHPAISEVISKQIRILNTNTRYVYDLFSEYGDKLLKHFPSKLCKVYFVNSGSEANDLAVRMARTYTQRNTVAVLEHGYHGNTTLGIEISSYKFDGQGGEGTSSSVIKLPLAALYNGPFESGKEYAEKAINQIEETNNHHNLAAFIAEPISGCGGQVPLAPGYLKHLFNYFNKNNIVTIIDEVQTGFGRLGNWFWGFEMHDVIPDIVVLGKPMGNGHPIAAVVTTKEISDSFGNGMEFFSSFGGNPVSCAVASTVLDVIEEEKLQANAKETGDYFKQALNKLQQKYDCIGEVRGEGLFLGVEFITDKGTMTAVDVKNELKNKFIITGTDGPFNSVIKIKPPMCFSINNVDDFINTLDEILKKSEYK